MRVVIGLGSNVGDRIENLRAAVGRVAGRARVVAWSRVYETAPVGMLEQPSFLNAAIAVEWGGEPRALLEMLLGIERDLGRTREVKWGPRTIDLDVLWIVGGQKVEEDGLVVPHPRLRERAFAVRPLLDVAPDAPFVVPEDQDVKATELSLVLTEP